MPHPTTTCFCPTSRALQLPSSRRCHAMPWPALWCACRHSPCQHQACGYQKQQVPHPDVLLPGACAGPEPAAGHHVWLISHHPAVGGHDTLCDGSTAGPTDVVRAAVSQPALLQPHSPWCSSVTACAAAVSQPVLQHALPPWWQNAAEGTEAKLHSTAGPAWQARRRAVQGTAGASFCMHSEGHAVLLVQGHHMQHHHHRVLCSPSQQRPQGLTMGERPPGGQQLCPLPHAELLIPGPALCLLGPAAQAWQQRPTLIMVDRCAVLRAGRAHAQQRLHLQTDVHCKPGKCCPVGGLRCGCV